MPDVTVFGDRTFEVEMERKLVLALEDNGIKGFSGHHRLVFPNILLFLKSNHSAR